MSFLEVFAPVYGGSCGYTSSLALGSIVWDFDCSNECVGWVGGGIAFFIFSLDFPDDIERGMSFMYRFPIYALLY